MQRELLRYQLIPCRETLGRLVTASETLRRNVARQVAVKMGRAQDQALVELMLAESSYRVIRMAGTLARLQTKNDTQIITYISKIARGAALDAADDPVYGPSRRNLKRRVTPAAASIVVDWPDEAFDHWPGPDTPTWSHERDRGSAYWALVSYVAHAARRLATGLEVAAVEQVIEQRTDEMMARRLGLGKGTWQMRRRDAMTKLATKIAWAAPFHIDEIGKEILGILWIEPAEKAELAVLYEEGQRAA